MKKNNLGKSKVISYPGAPNTAFRFLSLSLIVGLLCLNSFNSSAFTPKTTNGNSIRAKQAQKIIGKITDASTGEGLPGVSVIIVGTTTGASTDINGNYQLEVPNASSKLSFSFIGYTTQVIEVGNKSQIDVHLSAETQKLEEVVVVGYGTQKKSDVTGATVRVDEKALREIPAVNMQEALQGRAAGVEIQRIGTQPGAGAQIRIRGERSILGSNDPLIVLDGIPFEGNINDINQNDIESVVALKDASATAIYGSRGANGVILVSTKRGKAGQTKFSYVGYYGVSSVARKYPVYNAQEYRAMRDISPYTQGYMAAELQSIANGTSTNWQDLMYQNGYTTNHTLTASGGNEYNQFSIGGDYLKQTTVLPGQDFTRYALRATGDFKVGQKFKIGLNTMNSVTVNNGSQFNNPMFPIISLSPLEPAYNADGTINKTPAGNPDETASQYSPLLLKNNDNNWVDKVRRLNTFNSLYAEYEIIKGLKYRMNVGLNFRQQENDQFQGADSYFRPGKGNTASVNNSEGWGYTVENLLTFEKTFAQKHRISFTGLYSRQEDHTHNTYISKDSIDADFIEYFNLGQSNQSTSNLPNYSGSESSWGLISYMARINYAYDDKYLLTVTGRKDGSSRLAEGHKWHSYPAVSVGWNISKEAFMQNIKQISSLKLRAGWGETSNQAVSPYASLGGLSNSISTNGVNQAVKYNYGTKVVSGYYVASIKNPTLDWEYTRTVNIGLDFGLLNNRITGSVEVYKAKTHGILYSQSLPASSGVPNSYNTNIGKMENKGIEVTISSNNISTHGFTWSTDLNFFLNRNKLVSLQSGFTKNISNQLFVGQPLTAIYDYNKLGIWQTSEAVEAAKYGQLPGQIKVEDLNHDGVIDPDNDRKIIGSSEAKWQGGMTNRFSYKGFDFSFVLYTRMGGTLISGVHMPQAAYLTMLNGVRNGLKVDYWTPTNPTNDFPMPSATITPPKATTAASTLAYYDASFVKVRSINFGYTLPKSLLSKFKIETIRFYVTAQNPFLLYSPYVKKGGVDPEPTGTGTNGFVNSTGGNISSRALTIAAATPPLKSFLFGVNLNF